MGSPVERGDEFSNFRKPRVGQGAAPAHDDLRLASRADWKSLQVSDSPVEYPVECT
jgi:hypothetical protein